MFCKECGNTLHDDNLICPNCGFDNNYEPKDKKLTTVEVSESEYKQWTFWNVTAIISFICAIFTFYKGYDKMMNYSNREYYPYDSINTYVVGDAYNYIINANYSTAFFVLTTMFVIMGIGFIIIHYVSQKNK